MLAPQAVRTAMTAGVVDGDANGVRLGTQEVTRWGMRPENMAEVARFMAVVLLGKTDPVDLRPDVVAFRSQFRHVHFVSEAAQ